jgi:hypothetical protein
MSVNDAFITQATQNAYFIARMHILLPKHIFYCQNAYFIGRKHIFLPKTHIFLLEYIFLLERMSYLLLRTQRFFQEEDINRNRNRKQANILFHEDLAKKK